MGGLIQNHLREFLGMLDFYFAAALSLGGLLYRLLSPNPNPLAPLVLGHLTVILLGTLAQCQYGFDAQAFQMRARLLPLSGLQILLAKDAAWFTLVLLLLWPYPLMPALAATAMAAAVAHQASLASPIEQRRGRFAQGRLAPTGLLQIFALVSAGVAVYNFGAPILPLFLGIYAASLWWNGRKWNR